MKSMKINLIHPSDLEQKKDVRPFNKMKDKEETKSGKAGKIATAVATMMMLFNSACGEVASPSEQDAGTPSSDIVIVNKDAGTTQDAENNKVCGYQPHHVLKIGDQLAKVENGGKVKIGSDEYVVKDTGNEYVVILEGKDKDYVINGFATIDGVEVSYLGLSTVELNGASLQLEVYTRGNIRGCISTLPVNGTIECSSVNKELRVSAKVLDAVVTRKGEFALVRVDVYAKSTSGDEEFITVDSRNYVVDTLGRQIVYRNDAAGQAINLDLQSVGTFDAKSKMHILTASNYTLEDEFDKTVSAKDDVFKLTIGGKVVTVKVKEVYMSTRTDSYVALELTANGKTEVLHAYEGEELHFRISSGDDSSYIEVKVYSFEQIEPECK